MKKFAICSTYSTYDLNRPCLIQVDFTLKYAMLVIKICQSVLQKCDSVKCYEGMVRFLKHIQRYVIPSYIW